MKSHKILFLESFYSGSHKAFANGLIRNSKYNFDILTMPARFWKWRMKGAALYFANQIKNPEKYDLIFTTDLINIADLKVLLGNKCPPVILYFHENQLTYPLNKNEKLDYHYGLTDLTNSLSADGVIFNSHTHMNTFYTQLPLFLNHLPDFVPIWPIDKIKAKSIVIYPGIEDSVLTVKPKKQLNDIPLIIWNQRWEFDKNPESFFNILYKLKKEGFSFNLALLGESYKKQPPVFKEAKIILKENIVHTGYIKNYTDYISFLKKGDIVISTANQENYGIAIIEAILSGARPLMPERLSYPEIIPSEFHSECLYSDEKDLEKKIKTILKGDKVFKQSELIDKMAGFCWNTIREEYDNFFENLIDGEKYK